MCSFLYLSFCLHLSFVSCFPHVICKKRRASSIFTKKEMNHHPQAKGAWCGTKAPDIEVQIQVMNTIHAWRERKRRRRLTSGPYTVNVRFVDIKASDADADVPQADIDASMALMNERFASSEFSFTFLETVRVVNSEFATCGFTDKAKHTSIGAAYRTGDATVMNVYLCDIPEADRAAIAYFPFTVPLVFELDGIYLNPVYLGEGENTLAHEAGHWLGLVGPYFLPCSFA
jgi:hypothetical protein